MIKIHSFLMCTCKVASRWKLYNILSHSSVYFVTPFASPFDNDCIIEFKSKKSTQTKSICHLVPKRNPNIDTHRGKSLSHHCEYFTVDIDRARVRYRTVKMVEELSFSMNIQPPFGGVALISSNRYIISK